MTAVETEQMSAAETGQMSAVPESSGFAWACGVLAGAPRRGLTRGEESEEGGSVDFRDQAAPSVPSLLICF